MDSPPSFTHSLRLHVCKKKSAIEMTKKKKKKKKKRNKTTLKTRKRVLRSAWDISVSSLRQVCEKTKSDKIILSLSSARHIWVW